MPEAKYLKLKTVFVSVDPDRDTPERIEKFLSLFDKNIMGLTAETNNDPKLKEMMRKFRIYASKIEYEMDDDDDVKKKSEVEKNKIKEKMKNVYTIDHTVLTYLMDD